MCRESGSTEFWAYVTDKSGSITVDNREVYDVRMTLPPGLTCDRCVLMWTWWTSHTCTYDCDPQVQPPFLASPAPFTGENHKKVTPLW